MKHTKQYSSSIEEHLLKIKDAIKDGQSADITKLRYFLLNGADVPLYCVGSGGFGLSMRFCALLYSANKGMAQAVTPLLMNHVSDKTLKSCKVLLYSKGGSQVDTGFLCERMMKINPKGLCGIGGYSTTSKDKNKMIEDIRKVSENWNLFNWKSSKEFVSFTSSLRSCALIYHTFTGELPLDRLNIDSYLKNNYIYCYKNGSRQALPELKDIKTFICLYGGWGEPVAYAFESMMTEAGIANVQLCDLRNWCHGRFIFLSNHIEDSVIVLLLSPREKQYAERLFDAREYHDKDKKIFPDKILTCIVETEFDEPLATLDLAIKNSILINDIANAHGVKITDPKNKSNIDKRVPRPLKMKEQSEFGAVNLSLGKTGTLKGVSRKKVLKYDPKLSIKQIATKNGVSEATVRLYIKSNHIDRERDNQLLIFLNVHKIINKMPNISLTEIARKAKCSFATARKYAQMEVFDIPIKQGHISLVHDDTL